MEGLTVPMPEGLDPVPTDPLPVPVPVEVAPFGYKLILPFANPYVPLGAPRIPEELILVFAPFAFELKELSIGSAIEKRLWDGMP